MFLHMCLKTTKSIALRPRNELELCFNYVAATSKGNCSLWSWHDNNCLFFHWPIWKCDKKPMHFWKLKKNEVWASLPSSLKIASYEETSPDDGKTSNTKISYGIGCKSVHFLSALLLYSSTSLVVVARTNTAAAATSSRESFSQTMGGQENLGETLQAN